MYISAHDIAFVLFVACQVVAPAYYYTTTRHIDRYDEQWAFRMFSPDGQSSASIEWIINDEQVTDLRKLGVADAWTRVLTERTTPMWVLERAAFRLCQIVDSAEIVAFERTVAPFNAEGGDVIVVDGPVFVQCFA